jgi:hypothetical protein
VSWRERAEAELLRLADSGESFTADDLIAVVGQPDSAHAPNGANSAIGSLFRTAHALKWITPIGVKASRQPRRKGGMIRVWRGR